VREEKNVPKIAILNTKLVPPSIIGNLVPRRPTTLFNKPITSPGFVTSSCKVGNTPPRASTSVAAAGETAAAVRRSSGVRFACIFLGSVLIIFWRKEGSVVYVSSSVSEDESKNCNGMRRISHFVDASAGLGVPGTSTRSW
jgi:hypothetical protein